MLLEVRVHDRVMVAAGEGHRAQIVQTDAQGDVVSNREGLPCRRRFASSVRNVASPHCSWPRYWVPPRKMSTTWRPGLPVLRWSDCGYSRSILGWTKQTSISSRIAHPPWASRSVMPSRSSGPEPKPRAAVIMVPREMHDADRVWTDTAEVTHGRKRL